MSFCCWKPVCSNLIQWPITLTQLRVNPGSQLNYAFSILAGFILPPEPQTHRYSWVGLHRNLSVPACPQGCSLLDLIRLSSCPL